VALLRFVAAGELSVGHLWKESTVIHRTVDETAGENVSFHPPQMAMSESEASSWRVLNGWKYED